MAQDQAVARGSHSLVAETLPLIGMSGKPADGSANTNTGRRRRKGWPGGNDGPFGLLRYLPAWVVAVGALVAKSGYHILDESASRLAAHGNREQVLPGGK